MLTGPSAAALYGNAAANGVVLINTKKGSAEKTTLTVSNNTMFSDAYMMPEMQNRYGNNPGEFASWGNKTKQSYDPSRFFNTGVNVINAISFRPEQRKTRPMRRLQQPMRQVFCLITVIAATISLSGIRPLF